MGRRRADGSSLIRVEEIKDGIIAFEDEADAHRYAAMLEAEGTEVKNYMTFLGAGCSTNGLQISKSSEALFRCILLN